MKARISDKNSQQGWVLVIGLVVLVMLTLIAMALMRTTLLEEKMAVQAATSTCLLRRLRRACVEQKPLSKSGGDTPLRQAQVFMRERQPVIWSKHPSVPIGTMITPRSYRTPPG